MRVRALVSSLCWLLAAASQPWESANQGSAQDSPQNGSAYRVQSRLVMVDAQVVDKKTHRALTSLEPGDLEIYEDGVRQQISVFSQDQLPLSVVLLFDLTDSVRPVLKPLAAGAQKALEHLKPEDEVAVMVYAASTTVVQDFTTDRGLAAAAIARASRMDSGEAAFFNEAIFQAAHHLSRRSNSRRVIIWLTDDVPNIPSFEIQARYAKSLHGRVPYSEKEAFQELSRTGTLVCTLLQQSEISEEESARRDTAKVVGRMLYPPGDVYTYAQTSGGVVLESSARNCPRRWPS